MTITSRCIFALCTLVATVATSGCSATKMLVNEWSNPAYTSRSFNRVLVGGMGGSPSIRRNFEDEFVAQLRAAGVDGLPSYRYSPEDEKLDEGKLKQAAQEAGADAVIIARSVSVEQKTEVSPSYYPSPAFGIFGRNVSAAWYGLYGVPSVYRYDVYTSETTLYDVGKNEVVWTGTLKTTAPDNPNTAIKSYVQTVIKSLNEKNLLGGGRLR
ncbi:MAG TPA: hypothetical protein VFU31_00955 [Candidatus Binatia bacterium]|nr:hypothetical protein [Candidatus Binatia bacterium]